LRYNRTAIDSGAPIQFSWSGRGAGVANRWIRNPARFSLQDAIRFSGDFAICNFRGEFTGAPPRIVQYHLDIQSFCCLAPSLLRGRASRSLRLPIRSAGEYSWNVASRNNDRNLAKKNEPGLAAQGATSEIIGEIT
jgi:hypothetical protein